MLNAVRAADFAREWIAAWNARDLDGILSHYAEDIEFHSPRIAAVLGNDQAFVKGKAELRNYWNKALAMAPNLHFELERLYVGSDALTIAYRNHRGQHVCETFVFDTNDLVRMSVAAYS